MIPRARVLFALLVAVAAPALAVVPGDRHGRTPEQLRLRHQPVRFMAPDSVRLSGWWFSGPPHANVVVLAPRGEGTMANLLDAAKAFQQDGFSVLAFDCRDFGPGRPAAAESLRYVVFASRWVTDMGGALAYARSRVDTSARVFAWGGHDLPSMIALAAAARESGACDAVVVEGLFRTTEDILNRNGTSVLAQAVEQQKGKVLMRDEPAAAAARLRVPMLIVSGAHDSITTPRDAYAIASTNRVRHDRLLIGTGGHSDLEQAPDYFTGICTWLRRMALIPRSGASD